MRLDQEPDTTISTGGGLREDAAERHDRRGHGAAVMDAEVRALEHALMPWGVLTVVELERRVHGAHWHSGSFRAALRAAEKRGVVKLLPGGFVSLQRRR